MKRRKSQKAETAAGCVRALGRKSEISQEAPLFARYIPRSRRETAIEACAYWSRARPTSASCGPARHRALRRHITPRQTTSWRRGPCERYRLLVPGEGKATRLQFTAAIAARLLCAPTLIRNAAIVDQRAPRIVSFSVPLFPLTASVLFETTSERASGCVAEEASSLKSVGGNHGSPTAVIWSRTVRRSISNQGSIFNLQFTPVFVSLNCSNYSWTS